MSAFGDLLFDLRRRKRLLQKQVANTAKIDQSYLAQMERGRRGTPSPRVLERLCKALDATQPERERLNQAVLITRLEGLIAGPKGLSGGSVLVRIAELSLSLNDTDLALLESIVDLMRRATRKEAPM